MGTTEPENGRSPAAPPALPVPFLKRVKIRNYKSIAHCDVELGAFTALVGRNGAGKSNFLDALQFAADTLRESLDHVIRSHGGVDSVFRHGEEFFAIELEIDLDLSQGAHFGFAIRKDQTSGCTVENEFLELLDSAGKVAMKLERSGTHVAIHLHGVRAVEREIFSNDLYIKKANILGDMHYNFFLNYLESLIICSINPSSMRSPGAREAGETLRGDGSNLASVFGRIERERPEVKNRLIGYLSAIVPGISDIKRIAVGPYETLEFTQTRPGSPPSVFYPLNMSDGTLRAFGALVAVAQLGEGDNPVSLVGIEEPEAALHPAASGALMDALHEAAVHTQVVVTTHSPDLLDQINLESDRLLVAQMRDGVTEIGAVDPASREAIRDHLYTPGELLRMDQLQPDPKDLERQRESIVMGDAGTAE